MVGYVPFCKHRYGEPNLARGAFDKVSIPPSILIILNIIVQYKHICSGDLVEIASPGDVAWLHASCANHLSIVGSDSTSGNNASNTLPYSAPLVYNQPHAEECSANAPQRRAAGDHAFICIVVVPRLAVRRGKPGGTCQVAQGPSDPSSSTMMEDKHALRSTWLPWFGRRSFDIVGHMRAPPRTTARFWP